MQINNFILKYITSFFILFISHQSLPQVNRFQKSTSSLSKVIVKSYPKAILKSGIYSKQSNIKNDSASYYNYDFNISVKPSENQEVSSFFYQVNEIPIDFFRNPIPEVKEPSKKPPLLKYINSYKDSITSSNFDGVKSHILSLIISNSDNEIGDKVKFYFEKSNFPNSIYNIPNKNIFINRNLIKSSHNKLPQSIYNYLNYNEKIGNQIIAFWFNRQKNGSFNMDYIKDIGLYNASASEVATALKTKRGLSTLSDEGEKLISKSYVAVYDLKIVSKDNIVWTTQSFLEFLGGISEGLGVKNASNFGNQLSENLSSLNGFSIYIDLYLYKLNWNRQIEQYFFENYWVDNQNIDKYKVEKFDKQANFKLQYIGQFSNFADVTSLKLEKEELLEKLINKTLIKGIESIEGKRSVIYRNNNSINIDEIKFKSKINSVKPITAKIGTKEGIKKGDIFYVYEKSPIDDNQFEYRPLAKLKAVGEIWDNKFYNHQNLNAPKSNNNYTKFIKLEGGDIYEGALIVKGKLSKNKYRSNYSKDTLSMIAEINLLKKEDSLALNGQDIDYFYADYGLKKRKK